MIPFLNIGLIDYKKAWDLQKHYARKLRENTGEEIVIICSHFATFTLGKNGRRENILFSDKQLEDKNIDVVRINRGGDVTLHNPGQLVVYPILDLRRHGLSIPHYVNILEECLIQLLDEYGIAARRRSGYPGVWVEQSKIASIGINVSRGITTHGLALNVNNDLTQFLGIIPCGISGCVMSSVSSILNKEISMETLIERFQCYFDTLLP